MTSFMGGGGGGNGERAKEKKADVFLVELRNGETVLVEADSISCPVAKVCVGFLGAVRKSPAASYNGRAEPTSTPMFGLLF